MSLETRPTIITVLKQRSIQAMNKHVTNDRLMDDAADDRLPTHAASAAFRR